MNRLFALVVWLLTWNNCILSMSPAEAKVKYPYSVGLTEIIKHKLLRYTADQGIISEIVDASDEIVSMVRDSLEQCDITKPVIVLTHKNVAKNAGITNTVRVAWQQYPTSETRLKTNIYHMLIDTNDPAFLQGSIYHECAHLKHNDLERDDAIENVILYCNATAALALLFAGISKLKIPLIFKSIGAGILLTETCALSKYPAQIIKQMYNRYKEKRADRYAYNQMIHQKKYVGIIGFLNHFLNDCCQAPSKITGWLDTHPSSKERVKIGLEILKQHNLSIEVLLNDEQVQKLYDEETRNMLLSRVKNLYPGLT